MPAGNGQNMLFTVDMKSPGPHIVHFMIGEANNITQNILHIILRIQQNSRPLASFFFLFFFLAPEMNLVRFVEVVWCVRCVILLVHDSTCLYGRRNNKFIYYRRRQVYYSVKEFAFYIPMGQSFMIQVPYLYMYYSTSSAYRPRPLPLYPPS